MASLVLKSLSVLLGLFFIFAGATKLTPQISTELYKELRKEFAKYSKVFPLAKTFELKIPSKWYRRIIGGIEILCGSCLTFIPHARIKQIANIILVLLMVFATYNHYMVGDKFERTAPSLVFFFMLTCRLIVAYQTTLNPSKSKPKCQENVTSVSKKSSSGYQILLKKRRKTE